MSKTRFHKAILVSLILVLFILWWPTRSLPSFWDSSGYAMPFAFFLYTHDFKLPPPHYVYIHPPLYMYLLALTWSLTGFSLISAHFITFVFGLIYLVSSYLIANFLLGRWHAYLLSLLLLISPLFISQLGTLYMDLPVAALSLLGLYFGLKHRWLETACVFSFAVLIKLTAMPYLAFVWLIAISNFRSLKPRHYFFLTFPAISFLIWSYISFNHYGTWFIPTRISALIDERWTPAHILATATTPALHLLRHQYRYLISLLCFWGFIAFLNRSDKYIQSNIRVMSSLIGLCGLVFLFFGTVSLYADKYLLALLPVLYLVGLAGANIGTHHLKIYFGSILPGLILTCTVLLYFASQSLAAWHPVYQGPKDLAIHVSQEHTLAYRDMQQNWIDAAAFIESRYAGQDIFGGFPEIFELSLPYLGYVQNALPIFPCDSYPPEASHSAIMYLHPYAPDLSICQEIIKSHGATLLKVFKNHGWWIELYEINPPPTSSQ